VERISGQPFDEYCNDNLFAPLGMVNTSWRISDFPGFSIAPAIPYLYLADFQEHWGLHHYGSPAYPAGWLNLFALPPSNALTGPGFNISPRLVQKPSSIPISV
jgi:CubicO group peptidase (beta-lactamase class C family)